MLSLSFYIMQAILAFSNIQAQTRSIFPLCHMLVKTCLSSELAIAVIAHDLSFNNGAWWGGLTTRAFTSTSMFVFMIVRNKTPRAVITTTESRCQNGYYVEVSVVMYQIQSLWRFWSLIHSVTTLCPVIVDDDLEIV